MQLDGNFGLFSRDDQNREAELAALGLPDSFEGPIEVIDLHVVAAGALRAAESKRSTGDKTQETLNQIRRVRDLYGTIEDHIRRSLREANVVTITEVEQNMPESDQPKS